MKIVHLAILVWITSLAVAQQRTDPRDWNQWRGPDRKAIWYNGPEIETLHANSVRQIWEVEVGPGYSGPTNSKGRVYLMDYMDGNERVLCFDTKNGKELWSFSYPVAYGVGYPTGPRASVQIFGELAYSFGTMGHLFCFEAETGKVVWKLNAIEKYHSRIPVWGLASNPILVEDKLIVQLGGKEGACIVALQKENGTEVWRALDDEASYSAPILIEQAGKDVVLFWTGGRFTGLDPEDGSIYWSIPFKPRKSLMNISTPVYDPPFLFHSAFFDGSYLLKLDQETTSAELVYHRHGQDERNTDALHCCISTPILQDGYIYGIDSYGETRCLELETGERVWEDQTLVPRARWANVHLIRQNDRVWGFNEKGEILLGRFTPEGYEDLGRVKVIDPVQVSPNPRNGVNWSHPAFSGNRIYVRSDSKLVCVEINIHP